MMYLLLKTCIYIQIYVYIAAYSHIYLYMHHSGAQKVHETSLQRIHTQEAGVYYTKLTQLRCSATHILCRGL